MTEILLSIIIPAYNCEAYIEECMNSVLRQLPANCELIVVDDGSEDGTRRVLASFEGQQDNLKILYREHQGASGARNFGLDAAGGEFVTFIDCDDCLQAGFLEKSLGLTEDGADLFIFGIEWIPLERERELWTVQDRKYPDTSSFADEYIRVRQLLVYSNCNKFYRRNVIEKSQIRFEKEIAFGEDRLFNFRFLESCGGVVTSSLIMLEYIQRSTQSMSFRHIPGMFDILMNLHREKMKCFLSLSKGTSESEKSDFILYDLSGVVENLISRCSQHPEERQETLPKIHALYSEISKLERKLSGFVNEEQLKV